MYSKRASFCINITVGTAIFLNSQKVIGANLE